MRYLVTVSITVLLFTSVFSQTTKIDSLKHQLSLSASGRDRVDIMIQISNCFWEEFKIDSSFAYGDMAANLSRQINYPLGEAKGLHMTTAYVFFTQHNYVKCLSNCIYALTVFEKENDSIYILRSLGALAAIYALTEEFALAIYYDKKIIELAETMKNHDKVLEGIYGMAEGYSRLGNTDSSILYYQEGFRLTNLFFPTDSSFAKGRSYLGLARAFYLSQDYDIALSYLKKAYSYAQNLKSDGSSIKASIQSTYADIFIDLKEWDSALNRIKLAAAVGNNVDAGMYEYYENMKVANVFEHINKD
jgi:tetratricopeptide (TPR) repeat protein